jgi:protein TonB
MAMTGGNTTREGIARLALSGSDRTVRRRHVALAVSLLAHGSTLLAIVCLLQRVVLPAPSPEPSIAMVFAPAATLVDATPAPAGPPIAEPPPVEQASPSPVAPEPKVEETAPAIPPPVEQAAPLPAASEPEVEQAAPAVPPPVPVQHPAPRPSVHASRPAIASLSAPAAVAIAPLLPAHPVAGMDRDRPPAYPEMARRRGQQGRVVLQVNVSAEGMPVTVAVVETSGYASLDAAAMTAVQQWRFVPATRGGTPVPAVAEVPVRFRLTD